MNFKPGDPVWARCTTECAAYKAGVPAGEHPTVILRPCDHPGHVAAVLVYGQMWLLTLLAPSGRQVCAVEACLRPRRDDYQQHEGLGARDKLQQPLDDDPLPRARELVTVPGRAP